MNSLKLLAGGARRRKGAWIWGVVAFLLVLYLCILLMLTGKHFLLWLDALLPHVSIVWSWTWLRFLILFAILLMMILILYRLTTPRRDTLQIEMVRRLVEHEEVGPREHHLRDHAAHFLAAGQNFDLLIDIIAGKQHPAEERAQVALALIGEELAHPVDDPDRPGLLLFLGCGPFR